MSSFLTLLFLSSFLPPRLSNLFCGLLYIYFVFSLVLHSNLIKVSFLRVFSLILLFTAVGFSVFHIDYSLFDWPLTLFRIITIPFIFLVFTFTPYLIDSINFRKVQHICFKYSPYLLYFLFFIQLSIAFDFGPSLYLRESLYPQTAINYDSQSLSSLASNFRSIRLGGLFFNPNVQAQFVLLLTQAYFISSKYLFLPASRSFFTIAVISSLITGSRAGVVALAVTCFAYYYSSLSHLVRRLLIRSRTTKAFMLLLLLFLSFIIFVAPSLFSALFFVFFSGESGDIKFSFIVRHFNTADISTLLFGGTSSIVGEWDLGNSLSLYGTVGCIILILLLLYSFYCMRRDFFVSILFTSLLLYIFGGNMFHAIRILPLLAFIFSGYSMILDVKNSVS